MDEGHPQNFYQYALIDPVDTPFARFRYYYRPWGQNPIQLACKSMRSRADSSQSSFKNSESSLQHQAAPPPSALRTMTRVRVVPAKPPPRPLPLPLATRPHLNEQFPITFITSDHSYPVEEQALLLPPLPLPLVLHLHQPLSVLLILTRQQLTS